jgi:hypothetical protein
VFHSIFQYISDNKTWIFSGVGVLGISFVIWGGKLGWRKFGPTKPPVTIVESPQPFQPAVSAPIPPAVAPTLQVPLSPPIEMAAQPAATAPRRISDVAFAHIIQTVDSAPPLQQVAVAKTFAGLWVNWLGRLSNAYESIHPSGNISLSLLVGDRGDRIKCKVKVADYLELMHMRQGRPIRVMGRIETVEPGNVFLADAELSFPTEDPANVQPPPSATIGPPAKYPDIPKEQIKILKSLALYEDLIDDGPVAMADLLKRCDLTTTQFKHHAEELRRAKLIYVTYPGGIAHYQNSPDGAGWLIHRKEKY